jgi:hypothetical protein
MTVLFLSLIADGVMGLFFIPSDRNAFRCPHPVYHHGLLPNRTDTAKWGKADASVYPMITNSLGLRDRTPRQIPLKSDRRRLMIIGDSFGEGVGVPYEKTFVGLIEERLASSNVEVLNASVVSYSPKLYYLKTKYLVEQLGLAIDELMVFIDISDIANELSYELFEPAPFGVMAEFTYDLSRFGRRHSFTWYSLWKLSQEPKTVVDFGADGMFPCLAAANPQLLWDPDFNRATFLWTVNDRIYKKYGIPGLKLALTNMRNLVGLCKGKRIKMTIVVYPWLQQIVSQDLDSVQVRTWRDFARVNGAGFINLFPTFIDGTPIEIAEKRFFLEGDLHWNAAGHRLVANTVLERIK